jgi:hypothetical protein
VPNWILLGQSDAILRSILTAVQQTYLRSTLRQLHTRKTLAAMRLHWVYVPTKAERKPFGYCFTSKPLPHHLIAPA